MLDKHHEQAKNDDSKSGEFNFDFTCGNSCRTSAANLFKFV